MPMSYRACAMKGCPAVISAGHRFCAEHAKRERESRDQAKTDKRYNTARWQRLRASVLAREPLCRECAGHGVVTAAQVVDHITPVVDGGGDARDNLQPLCASCHNQKTQRETNARSRSARGG